MGFLSSTRSRTSDSRAAVWAVRRDPAVAEALGDFVSTLLLLLLLVPFALGARLRAGFGRAESRS